MYWIFSTNREGAIANSRPTTTATGVVNANSIVLMSAIVNSIKNDYPQNPLNAKIISFNGTKYMLKEAIKLKEFDITISIELNKDKTTGMGKQTTIPGYTILSYLLNPNEANLPGGPLKYYYEIFDILLVHKDIGKIINDRYNPTTNGYNIKSYDNKFLSLNQNYSVFYDVIYFALSPPKEDGKRFISDDDFYNKKDTIPATVNVYSDSIDNTKKVDSCAGVLILNKIMNANGFDIKAPAYVRNKTSSRNDSPPNGVYLLMEMTTGFNKNAFGFSNKDLLERYKKITDFLIKAPNFNINNTFTMRDGDKEISGFDYLSNLYRSDTLPSNNSLMPYLVEKKLIASYTPTSTAKKN